jgi:CheY-like chemotaxis protein
MKNNASVESSLLPYANLTSVFTGREKSQTYEKSQTILSNGSMEPSCSTETASAVVDIWPKNKANRILLIDDEDPIRQICLKALTRVGYIVDGASCSEDGWTALLYSHYDLLITDDQMPGLSGFELIRKLRLAKVTMPVILASGAIGPEIMTANKWLPPATILSKPFSMNELLESVAEALPRFTQTLFYPDKSRPAQNGVNAHWGINE